MAAVHVAPRNVLHFALTNVHVCRRLQLRLYIADDSAPKNEEGFAVLGDSSRRRPQSRSPRKTHHSTAPPWASRGAATSRLACERIPLLNDDDRAMCLTLFRTSALCQHSSLMFGLLSVMRRVGGRSASAGSGSTGAPVGPARTWPLQSGAHQLVAIEHSEPRRGQRTHRKACC